MNRFFRIFAHPSSLLSGISGGLSAISLICAVCPVRLALGGGSVEDAALALLVAACLWLTRPRERFRRQFSLCAWLSLPASLLWALLVPGFLLIELRLLKQVSLLTLESPVVRMGIALLFFGSLVAPVLCGAFLNLQHQAMQRSRMQASTAKWPWLLGFSLACLLLPAAILPWVTVQAIAWAGLAGSLCIVVWERFCLSVPAVFLSSETAALSAPPVSKFDAPRQGIALLTGGILAMTVYVASQLVPRTPGSDLTMLAGAGLALTLAVWWSGRHPERRSRWSPQTELLCLSAWMGGVAAGYPLWTAICLQTNAWVQTTILILAIRACLLMALVFPAGLMACRLLRAPGMAGSSAGMGWGMAIGFAMIPWILWSASATAMLLASTSLLLALACWSLDRFALPASIWQGAGLVCLLPLALAGVMLSGNLNPGRSEKLLYSSQTSQLLRQGIPAAQLPWMDDGRLAAGFDGWEGRSSLWVHRGGQMVSRQNGLTTGLHSIHPNQVPHSAGDILPMLVPLTFHPRAEDVLILGMHPAAILTCHEFPLRLVRTLDGNPAAHRQFQWLQSSPAAISLQNGADFQFGHVDVPLAMVSRHERRYDLIACPMLHPAMRSAAAWSSREFYANVRAALNENGIFSQRIPYYDLGPEVVRTLAASLRSEFAHVMMLETVPGELLFLCSSQSLPRIDTELVSRLQTPQCRRLLGQSGWDWSMILARGCLTPEALEQYAPETTAPNSVRDGRLSFRLPVEIARWGQKAENTRLALAEFGGTLRLELGESEASREVTQRLEDLSLSHQLQQSHPNDPWGYRKALKDRLKDRPRSELVHVKHEGLQRVLAPEDKHRKAYLQALGKVARQEQPQPEQIARLVEFAEPFDPLLSFFVYHEAAELTRRSGEPDSRLELDCLLHTIYFASPQDQSIQNVCQALRILCEQVPAEQDLSSGVSTTARWDTMNALLQVMAQRWESRRAAGKSSRFDLVDLDQSHQVIEQALQELSDNYQLAGLSAEDWKARHDALETVLIRPLQQHRSAQLRQVKPGAFSARSFSSGSTATKPAAPSVQMQ